jgi:hypothetical protein
MTMYAIVVDDTILKVGSRPKAYRNHTGLQYATDEQLAAIGILPVVDVERPADTDTHTFERSVELVAGVPTEVWTPRAWTVDELAARTRAANAAALTDLQVLQAKIAEIKSFLTDPDIDVALNIANATPLTTQQLNRALKSIIRQLRRSANLDVRAFRYVFGQVHPELLDDVSDAAI